MKKLQKIKILVARGRGSNRLRWLARLLAAGLTFGLGLTLFAATQIARKRLAETPQNTENHAAKLLSFEDKSFSSHSWRDFATLAELASLRGAEGTVSPYEINYLINACHNGWLSLATCLNSQFSLEHYRQKLGVEILSGVNLEKKLGYNAFPPHFGLWASELTVLDLSNNSDTPVVVRLYESYYNSYTFLFFRRSNSQPIAAGNAGDVNNIKWEFTGAINGQSRYAPPKYRIFVQAEEKFFSVETVAASGSGFAMFIAAIYHLAPNGLPQLVGHYYARGHDGNGHFGDIEFSSTLLRLEWRDKCVVPYLRYDFSHASDNLAGTEKLKFTASRVLRVSAVGNSEILTAKGYHPLAFDSDESYDLEHFFCHVADFLVLDNYDALMLVAQSGNEARKKQVKDLVNTCSYSPQAAKKAAQILRALR